MKNIPLTNLPKGLTRREALRRAALLAGAAGLPFGCAVSGDVSPVLWEDLSLAAVTAQGYGTDPDVMTPASAPWPRTLTAAQRELVGMIADILIPAEGGSPAATQVGTVDVVDEWVSAPYPMQQAHRTLIVSGLDWCDREARRRYGKRFTGIADLEQLAIIDDIAFIERALPAFQLAAVFFAGLRQLVTGIYYSSPEGVRELGYVGNIPIAGDWPGPTAEAMTHLQQQLDVLGLTL